MLARVDAVEALDGPADPARDALMDGEARRMFGEDVDWGAGA
jgi:hypothetical protein